MRIISSSQLRDMPKLESPFERAEVKGKGYICIPKLKEKYAWFVDPSKVQAVEKLDGTNVSVYVQNGKIERIFNRTNLIDIWSDQSHFFNGISNAINRKYFKPEFLLDGQYFGELLGPKIQGNSQEVDTPIWVPFDYAKKHYSYKFYNNWLKEMFERMHTNINRTEPDEVYLYNEFKELFTNLQSLWFRQRQNGRLKRPEGIVFYNTETDEMCKLRMDMFGICGRNDWHKLPDLKKEE